MTPEIPAELRRLAHAWDELNIEGRRQVGRSLRTIGLTYGEIRRLIPVPKSTLSGWCRGIRLSPKQVESIKRRTIAGRGTPRNTQWRRRLEIAEIERSAGDEVHVLVHEQLWLAGTVMYWAEGAKTNRALAMANTDPSALNLFLSWARAYHDRDARFSMMLHLHAGNDEGAAKRHWSTELGLHDANWHKTFIKPPGSGHRKNRLEWGVCRVTMRRSTDAFIRTLAWIERLRTIAPWAGRPSPTATLPPGR